MEALYLRLRCIPVLTKRRSGWDLRRQTCGGGDLQVEVDRKQQRKDLAGAFICACN